jgi:acid phosphatase family membrane protein YuiD
MNHGICTALSGIITAQALKIPIKYAQTGKMELSTFFETGGMPSSHSAGVSALASFIALRKGMKTVDFALASIFGMIVMYDAMGIRRYAGETAMEVNHLEEEVEKLVLHHAGNYRRNREEELKEKLGHMPVEVLGGVILGIAVGSFGHLMSRKMKKRMLHGNN